MSKVKYCEYCRNHPEVCKQVIFPGYSSFWEETTRICPFCNNSIVDTILEDKEENILSDISHDSSFLEAMIDLKQKDPIEFQLKMSQFNATQNQTKIVEESNGPHCPYCNSADLKKISGLSKAGSVALWGIFAVGKVSKQWRCNSCKSDF